MDFFSSTASIFTKGGLVMYPLLACSVMVVAIAIERFFYYGRAKDNTEILLVAVKHSLAKGDWDEAIKICEGSSSAIAIVLAAGLSRGTCENRSMENALEGAAALETAKLRRRLDYLNTIITIAPLLGLLGTVVGMIHSFSVLNIHSGQPQAITGGVGEALVATATGLCIAIAAMVVHSYFKHQLDGIVTDMEQACTYLLDNVDRRPRK